MGSKGFKLSRGLALKQGTTRVVQCMLSAEAMAKREGAKGRVLRIGPSAKELTLSPAKELRAEC